jgi:hypothetical protein
MFQEVFVSEVFLKSRPGKFANRLFPIIYLRPQTLKTNNYDERIFRETDPKFGDHVPSTVPTTAGGGGRACQPKHRKAIEVLVVPI